MSDLVLVTGASGFIGGHTIAELLRRGYAVRGSVRSHSRNPEVHEAMAAAGVDTAQLELHELDLRSDHGWSRAVEGCRFVLHIASPFVLTKPDHPDDLIRPAVDGATRALGAAIDAGVERVVMTSALATMQFARAPRGHLYSDADWADPADPRLNPYTVSKIEAERAALALAHERGYSQQLAFINPGAVIGELLTDDPGTSVGAIQQIMSGALPMVPDLRMPWVDVQDVAEAHIAAMTSPVATGRRLIVATDPMSLVEVARIIRDRVPESRGRIPRMSMPTWLTWAASAFEPQLRDNRWLIGQKQRFDGDAVHRILQRPLLPVADAIERTARSLLTRRLV